MLGTASIKAAKYLLKNGLGVTVCGLAVIISSQVRIKWINRKNAPPRPELSYERQMSTSLFVRFANMGFRHTQYLKSEVHYKRVGLFGIAMASLGAVLCLMSFCFFIFSL